jgi:hypothetical protein
MLSFATTVPPFRLDVSCVDNEVFRVTVSCANFANALVTRGQVRLVGSVLTPFSSLNSAMIVVVANPCLHSVRCGNGPFSNSKLRSLLGTMSDFNAISRLQSPTYTDGVPQVGADDRQNFLAPLLSIWRSTRVRALYSLPLTNLTQVSLWLQVNIMSTPTNHPHPLG